MGDMAKSPSVGLGGRCGVTAHDRNPAEGELAGMLIRDQLAFVRDFKGTSSRLVALANTLIYALPASVQHGRHPFPWLSQHNIPFTVSYRNARLKLRMPSYDFLALKEVWQRAVYEQLAPASGIVCDVGAQVGTFSVRCALNPSVSRVLAFEPEPDNLALLEHNVRINAPGRIDVHGFALGDRVGRLPLYRSRTGTGHHTLVREQDGDALEVEVRRLDDVLSESGIHRVDWLKIDVEGYELNVLEGARRTLESSRPVLAVEVDSDWGALEAFLRSVGYDRFLRGSISPIVPGAGILNADSPQSPGRRA